MTMRRSLLRRAAPTRPLLAALLAASGCGDADVPGWTTRLDTLPGGGFHVIHTPPDDAAPAWALEPELRIGAMDGTGPDVFGDIASIAVGPGGRMVVLDGQAQEVRLFDPDGQHLRTFGGKGGGPGEFQGANGVAWGPDGLIRVADHSNTRLSFLDPDDGFVGSHRYEPLMFSYPWGGVVDDQGRTWSRHYRPGISPGEGRTVWVGLDTAGVAVDSLLPRAEERLDEPGAGGWNVPMGERRLTMGVPGYPNARAVFDPLARLWTTRQGDPSYRLVRWTADGDTALILEVRRPPVPTDLAPIDSMLDRTEQRLGVTLDRSKIPDLAPAIRGFFFDDDGRVWVQAATPPGDDRVLLDAFDANTGDYLGTLSTELGLQTSPPPVIRGDTVWAVVRDEVEVPGVVRGRVVAAHLRRMKAVGAFSVKSYNQRRRDARQWIVEAARDLEMMVVPEGGSLFYNNMTMVLDGHTGVEHSLPVPNVYGDVTTLWGASSTGYTPTMVVGYGGLSGEYYFYERTNVWEDARLLAFTPKGVVDARSRRRIMAAGDDDFNHVLIARGVKDIADAGGLVHLGAHGQMQGLGAHWELWMFQHGGMSEMEALAAGTITGAQYLGLDRDIGSLEPGKLADLVVLNSNPLDDLTSTTDIHQVMLGGQLYDAMTLRRVAPTEAPAPVMPWERGRR